MKREAIIVGGRRPGKSNAVIDAQNQEIQKLRARVAEIEKENAELQQDRERLAEVHAYLLGEAPMAGRWFGDDLPPKTPKFWWRRHLRRAIDNARGED